MITDRPAVREFTPDLTRPLGAFLATSGRCAAVFNALAFRSRGAPSYPNIRPRSLTDSAGVPCRCALVVSGGWSPWKWALVMLAAFSHPTRSLARDRTITRVKQIGRRRWKKASGYHGQAGVENAFFRYKSIIGEGLRARSPGGQGAEALIACNVLNRMTELGRPDSYSIGW